MKIIIGLGNPGGKYKNTRHNLGQNIAMQIAEKFNFPKMTFKKSLLSLVTVQIINKQKIVIACPTVFMNLSGKAVAALKKFYKVQSKDIWLIYDDLALPLGNLRIRLSGSSGGHKGAQSVIDYLKTDQFAKFRIGIQPKQIKTDPADFVLKKFSKIEIPIVKKSSQRCLEAIEYALKLGLEKTMSKFN